MTAANEGIRAFTRLLAAAALALTLGAAAKLAGAETLKYGSRIVCPGEYRGHLQGIATDGKAVYWVFSRNIVKTGLDGRLLAKREVPYHSGDPCWKDGRLYVPVCRSGFNRRLKPGAESKNYVHVFDAKLKLLETRHIPEVEFGAGGIAAKDGHFFVVSGRPDDLPGNTVYEYDADFKPIARREAEFASLKGIQTINHADGKWYFGCYGTGGLTVETDENFRVTRRLRPGASVGMIPLANGLVLIGEITPGKVHNRKGAAARVVRFTVPKPKTKP